jgi:single-stranded-DNA-specific exonuclease
MVKKSTWMIIPERPETEKLAAELKIPPAIARILVNRSIADPETARMFLFGSLKDLHDPYALSGMKAGVERIRTAVERREKILVFGDYDVDGVLSVVMLTKALQSLGADVEYFIPERLKEGYGIKEEHIRVVLERGVRLVISVDCGIKANAFVRRARENGVDCIITDHHRPGEELPEALAILNPVLKDSGYPDKALAGVGVAFKLIHALLESQGKAAALPHYTKMVAIGTIADVADLRGENRIFVRHGLKGLENVSNIGLRSLIDNCGLKGRRVSEGDVGFRIGPRINAAGRMGMTDLAVQLFFTDSLEKSLELVKALDKLNSKRQTTEERIFKQAVSRIDRDGLDRRHKILMLGCEEWHRGVTGIVASKLKDRYHRPVILFAYEDGKAFGSGRSISEFPLIDCLEECRDAFLDFGGHKLAVGCVLARENMAAMKSAVNAVAESRMKEEDLVRKIRIDAPISFADITLPFLEHFSFLYPFGVGNPKPVFLTERADVMSDPQKLQGKHLKFTLKQGGRVFEALGWDKAEWAGTFSRGDRLDLVYTLQFSEYMGEERLNLSVEDIRR